MGRHAGDIIDRNSIHQFIEFPILLEDEFDEFMRDRTGWFVTKAMARTTELLEPMAKWNLASNTMFGGHLGLAQTLSSPETKKMIETLWKINELNEANMALVNQFDEDIEEKGFPVLAKALAGVPYDNYSDMFRGTLDGMMDMMMREELVLQFCREDLVKTKEYIKILGKLFPGRHVFMPLHKGMDTFMNPEQYRTFYWNDLREIIHTIIEVGLVPYIYTEGGYDTRLECLREVPKGKVLYHFEKVDMVNAKKILGGTACISGGFPTYLLDHGTKQQVIDEVKGSSTAARPAAVIIFSTACGID
jgi:hypothetical protein